MRIAMAQVNSGTEPDANLAVVAREAARAASAGADLIVFPEAMMCRFGVSLAPVAEPVDGPWATGVAEIAAGHGLTVVAGMFTPAADAGDGNPDRVRNTLVAVGPDGAVTSYDKMHLYDAFGFRESDTVVAGDRPVTVEVAGARVGLATCYDIRFPALFTALARAGAGVIVVPASWGAGPGKVEQWRVLARARALDSSSFVAAVGQAQPLSDPESSAPRGVGHSMVAGPFGQVLAEYGAGEHLRVHELDLAEVRQARASIAVLDNARSIG